MRAAAPNIARNRKIGCAGMLLFLIVVMVFAELMHRPAAVTPEAVAIERPQFLPCPDGDKVCLAEQEQQSTEWPLALKGDYQSQRNVAYYFTQSQNRAMRGVRRPVQGCAWRMVILASGSASVDDLDREAYRMDCRHLASDDLARAKAVAELISRRVYGSGLGFVPPLEQP